MLDVVGVFAARDAPATDTSEMFPHAFGTMNV